ncbi:MAG: hypothetical protein HOJ79_16540 [Nitrospina sp.]|jgi:hypothetical protein|nr:hypothetical protein [Nitrospina sp.]
MKLNYKTALVFLGFIGVLLFTSEDCHARKITRETDCGKDKICAEAFKKQKDLWLQCLEAEGLSEKKRKKLSARVEVLGIRNLKKQEVLIFDSGRKRCHKNFYEALSEIPQGENKKSTFPLGNPGNLPGVQ